MKRDGLLLLILASVFLLPLVSSANTVNITHPLQDASISGTQIISGNLDTNTINLSRAWFYLMLSNTTNITLAQNTINQSSGVFNYSLVTTTFYDLQDATLQITVANESGIGTNTTDYQTGVDINNGNPTATISSATFTGVSNGYTIKGTQIITAGLNADNTIGISSCRVILTNIGNGTVTDTGTTMTGNACANTTLQADVICKVGNAYNVVVQATDNNSDRVNSSSRRINCISNKGDSDDGGAGGVSGGASQSFFGSGGKVSNFAKTVGSTFSSFIRFLTFWTNKY